jgi:hypothetical protein
MAHLHCLRSLREGTGRCCPRSRTRAWAPVPRAAAERSRPQHTREGYRSGARGDRQSANCRALARRPESRAGIRDPAAGGGRSWQPRSGVVRPQKGTAETGVGEDQWNPRQPPWPGLSAPRRPPAWPRPSCPGLARGSSVSHPRPGRRRRHRCWRAAGCRERCPTNLPTHIAALEGTARPLSERTDRCVDTCVAFLPGTVYNRISVRVTPGESYAVTVSWDYKPS